MLGMPTKQTPAVTGITASPTPGQDWIKQETDAASFNDLRLARRCTKLLGMMSAGLGQSIPFACQDWASTKAAYRFLDHDQLDEAQILAGHFHATRDRLARSGQTVLLLHDTCEFSFQRKKDSQLGLIGRASFGTGQYDHLKHFTVRGLLMHSTLALTLDGLPLGLTALKFWTRQQFKGCNALKRKVNPTRVPIEEKESFRWLENLRQSTALLADPRTGVHIGDRESDIYELFCLAEELGTRFLVRTCVDRLAEDDQHTIAALMQDAPVRGRHRIQARNKLGQDYSAELELKYAQMQVLPPVGKRKACPPLTLTVIHAVEHGTPTGREPIVWKLLTNLPVNSRQDAIEKLNWYALRWKIEVFHKILKSGCKIEESNSVPPSDWSNSSPSTASSAGASSGSPCGFGPTLNNPPGRSSPKWNSNCSTNSRGHPTQTHHPASVTISSNSPNSAAISPAPVIRHPAIKSSGAASPAYMTSTSVTSWPKKMWVIKSYS